MVGGAGGASLLGKGCFSFKESPTGSCGGGGICCGWVVFGSTFFGGGAGGLGAVTSPVLELRLGGGAGTFTLVLGG